MKTKHSLFLALLGLGILAVGLGAFSADDKAKPGSPTASSADPKGSGSEASPHAADEAAIRASSRDFVKALEKADAKAVASFWTEEGEYIADDGTTFRGRAAIEDAFSKYFAKTPKPRVELQIDSIRFVSKDTAIEEGFVKLYADKSKLQSSSRYSALRVRDGGKWLMGMVREWPDEGTTLQDIDWLIGSWTAKTDGAEIRTTYEWDESKKFIRMTFTITRKDGTTKGTEMIGRDPRTGQLHTWLFESDGGFGEAAWTWDGKRWALEAFGVQPDGSEMTATNILTPIDKDAFTWQSTDRTIDGDEVPPIPPVKVTRVK